MNNLINKYCLSSITTITGKQNTAASKYRQVIFCHSEYTQYTAGHIYTLKNLEHWTSECSKSHAQGIFVYLVIYVGRKKGDLFMNEWSAAFYNHQ